ncbi:plastid transcriptionally active [Thalictrum thalictroides]|uniref:Plastid transcriptionally active n=1 Tax=Thalictrum thalictroides TaxID=46969 RepID=A0A7J6W3A5_THATH|nr:plastid transcriptionally active [Thalictrum thalictroides]
MRVLMYSQLAESLGCHPVIWQCTNTLGTCPYSISNAEDDFVDGAVIVAARTLHTWLDWDMPIIPSTERKAARDLQGECQQMLAEFPTTSDLPFSSVTL